VRPKEVTVAFAEAIELLERASILLHHVTASGSLRQHVDDMVKEIERKFAEWR
jgi:hypothetical protein